MHKFRLIDMRDMVLKEIALNKIVVYSKSDCMVSEASKIIIEGHEIPLKVVELNWLENGKEIEQAVRKIVQEEMDKKPQSEVKD